MKAVKAEKASIKFDGTSYNALWIRSFKSQSDFVKAASKLYPDMKEEKLKELHGVAVPVEPKQTNTPKAGE